MRQADFFFLGTRFCIYPTHAVLTMHIFIDRCALSVLHKRKGANASLQPYIQNVQWELFDPVGVRFTIIPKQR